MARNYTEEEQRAAVEKLVRTSIRREYGALGNRKTDVEFGDVQDAAAGVFILYPNSPFYVVWLSCQVLAELAASTEEVLDDLDDTVRATDRHVTDVEKIASLANARSALSALEGATAERETSLVQIEQVPAYQRFEQSTARFLRDYGKNISSGGDIVQTPQEARSRLAGLVSNLQSLYEEVVERAEYIRDAITDFDSMNLPATLSYAVISNSRQVIDDRFDELYALTPEQRLSKLRDVVLDVLATRSSVKGFGALNPTFTFLYFGGEGGPYADEDYPCSPASIQASIPGPYVVLDDTRLDLLVDGTYTISVDLPKSYVASIPSFIPEPYDIYDHDDAGPPPTYQNNIITLQVTGWADLDITFVAGLGLPTELVCSDINAQLAGRPVIAEPYNIQVRFSGEVALVNASGSHVDMEKFGLDDWDSVTSQPKSGDYIYLSGSVAGNDGWYEVVSVAGLPTYFTASKQSGSPSNEANVVGELGSGPRGMRIRFTDAYAPTAVANRESLGLVVGEDEVKQWACNTFGFIRDVTVTSQRSPVQNCREFINDNPAIAPLGTAVLEVTRVFQADHYSGEARSEPTDNLKVVLAELEATVTITNGGFHAQLFFSEADMLSIGDIVVIRSATTNRVGAWGVVDQLGTGYVWVMFSESIYVEASVTIEAGKDYRSSAYLPAALKVSNEPPHPNDGEYEVVSLGGLNGDGPPFELALNRPLISHTELGYQRTYFDVEFGQYYLAFTSASTGLDSAIELLTGVGQSPAGPILWSSYPVSDVGDTIYWSMPEDPKQVEEGDYLELKDTSAQLPTFVTEVVKTHTGPNLLELADSVLVNIGSYDMQQEAPAPAARVRKRKRNNFDVLSDAVKLWLEDPLSNTGKYFADLRKLLNPIIVNKNPTAGAIQAASDQLSSLILHLQNLGSYLEVYEAPIVDQVDRLIETYQQQGSQRAVDILLQSRFTTFFGLDQDEVSYTGNLQKTIRQVNIRDLPQEKFNRNPGGEVIDSYEEPNFEFDTSDTDNEVELDPPDESYDYPGSAF